MEPKNGSKNDTIFFSIFDIFATIFQKCCVASRTPIVKANEPCRNVLKDAPNIPPLPITGPGVKAGIVKDKHVQTPHKEIIQPANRIAGASKLLRRSMAISTRTRDPST